MKYFVTKAHLLKELALRADEKSLRRFAKAVNCDPLNDFEVRTSGESSSILNSLKSAPKAVLEDIFEEQFGESYDQDLEDDMESDEDFEDLDCEEEEDEDE
jgi:hypothetical protein